MMEASCIFCGGVSASILKSPTGIRRQLLSSYRSPISHRVWASASIPSSKRRSRRKHREGDAIVAVTEKSLESGKKVNQLQNPNRGNGDPLGRRDLGKAVVKWISQGMKAMAVDFAMAEMEGDFAELGQRMGSGLTFVVQAQPYLNAVPMPLGVEAICLKACTHYPTLFDHFQRELRDVLQQLQRKSLIDSWRETQSWMLLKELANSGSLLDLAHISHRVYLL